MIFFDSLSLELAALLLVLTVQPDADRTTNNKGKNFINNNVNAKVEFNDVDLSFQLEAHNSILRQKQLEIIDEDKS